MLNHPNSDCISYFSNVLEPKWIQFVAKNHRKIIVPIQYQFNLPGFRIEFFSVGLHLCWFFGSLSLMKCQKPPNCVRTAYSEIFNFLFHSNWTINVIVQTTLHTIFNQTELPFFSSTKGYVSLRPYSKQKIVGRVYWKIYENIY